MRPASQIPRTQIAALLASAAVLSAPEAALAAEGFKLIPTPGLLIANLIVFAVLIYPVNKLLVAPLVNVLKDREEQTAGSTQQAEGVRADSVSEAARLEERMAEARRDAQAERNQILAEAKAAEQSLLEAAREEAASEVAAVREAIGDELEQARRSLSGDAQALAQEVATRVLGRAL